MEGCWQAALLQQLQGQLASAAAAGSSSSSSDSKDHPWWQHRSAPVLVQGLLQCLQATQAAAAAAGETGQELPARMLPHSQAAAEGLVMDQQAAALLGQLLSGLLQHQTGTQQSPVSTSAAPGGVASCHLALEQLLLQAHTAAELLSWLLQHPAAAMQLCSGVTNSTSTAAAAALELHGATDHAQGAAVADSPRVTRVSPACKTASAAAAVMYPPAVLQLAERLHQLQAHELPAALQQLQAAQVAAATAAAVTASARGTPLATPTAAAAAAKGGCNNSKKPKRGSWAFFVVRTPADKQQGQQQQQQQQGTPGLQQTPAATADMATPVAARVNRSMPAATAAAAAGEGVAAQPASALPLWLLQLPRLPAPACCSLLAAGYSLLQTALATQQQQQPKPHEQTTPGERSVTQ
jgi:hypothetical protein